MGVDSATVAIDASTIVRGMTGVGYYTANIAAALAASRTPHRYVLLSNRPIEHAVGSRFTTDVERCPTRLAWLQLSLPRQVRRHPVDLIHYTNYMASFSTRLPYVLTLYDMTLKLFPRKHELRRSLVLGTLQPSVARRAALIITLSENSKDDIVRLLRVEPERIRVVPGAAGQRFTTAIAHAEVDRVRSKYSLPQRFALHVGTIEPRKNVPLLIDAFAAARHRASLPHSLVLAGRFGWRSAAVREAIRRSGDGFVRTLGYVDDSDLPALYRAAELFICPTSYEGFGLPNLEAMACGTPVVTTRTSSIPEVVGEAAVLVEPDRVEPLTDAICMVATDEQCRQELSAAGVARARHFSWAESARKTQEVYEEALGFRRVSARPVANAPHESFTEDEWRFALARLAYHDLFDYPLTCRQMMHGLNGHIPESRISELIESQPLMHRAVERHGELYSLKGRGGIATEREARRSASREVLRRNWKEIERIGRMPFVRMVAVSGALSYGNNRPSDDIDLFLIARSGRVWLTFVLLVFRHRISGKRGTFCPNFLIGDRDLAIRERNFYNAQQIAGLQPVTGERLFQEFLGANTWIQEHHLAAPPDFPVGTVRLGGLRVTERLLGGRLGDLLESLARRIGMSRMNRKRAPAPLAVNLDRDYIKLHFVDHRDLIVNRYREGLQRLGLTLEDARRYSTARPAAGGSMQNAKCEMGG